MPELSPTRIGGVSRIELLAYRPVYVVSGSFSLVLESTNIPDKCEHVASDVTLSETGPGIGEEILPLPLESIVVSAVLESRIIPRKCVLGQVGFESPSPFSESSRIICGIEVTLKCTRMASLNKYLRAA